MVDLSAEVQQDPFALLVDGVTEYAIVMLDRHGFVRTWNSGAERVNGYGAHEIVGQHFSVFYPPDDVDDGRAERELEVAAADGRYTEEGWRVRKDGSSFWANVVITSLRTPDGRLRGFAQVVRDETERRDAEEDRLRLRTLEAGERVVRDLHNDVIQRLFGIGLVLSGAVELIADPDGRDRVLDAISHIDATISHVRVSAWDHAADRTGAPPGPDVAGEGPRVLVVDDDADVRELIALTLDAELSARVTGVGDAYQALAALESEPYDVLLLDLMLPGINGEDLLLRMQDTGIDVDTIVISGWTSGPLVDRLVAHPAVRDVLMKPIDRDRLTVCVERTLLRSRT